MGTGSDAPSVKCAAFCPTLEAAEWQRSAAQQQQTMPPTADGPTGALPVADAAMDDLHAVDAAMERLLEIVPRARGGLPMLGSAAQGAWETCLGSYQSSAMPAAKRAAEAIKACEHLRMYVDSRPSDDTNQVAWTVLSHSVLRALDYDLRLCPIVGALRAPRSFGRSLRLGIRPPGRSRRRRRGLAASGAPGAARWMRAPSADAADGRCGLLRHLAGTPHQRAGDGRAARKAAHG